MPYKQPTSEPVAIVGSSCRFSGDVTSPSTLWNLLQKPADLSKEVPPGRFNVKAFYHPDAEYHGTTDSPKAYWLEQDHRVFDASFFNITPKEAEAVDPQQRMALEVVYEAMESAGYSLQQYAGQDVAVFAGVMTADYDTLAQRDELTASQYYATGNARSIISNRISYFFNFNGPSMTIDTACSSSLVALHQAVLSLRSGESVMACVTGVNLMITPEQFIVESNLHMLSPTGHCRMWDASADGYARGEGVAAVFLKPLSRALADGDRIEAVIRETGVNSDGRTQGITMPNPAAQAQLIRDTYRRTGLDARDPDDRCQFFEAHGTGTQAGDPREAAAIEDAFFGKLPQEVGSAVAGSDETMSSNMQEPQSGPGSMIDTPRLMVGSVKTVIGHTEGAAGLAGLLKVTLAMEHSTIPPNLHLGSLNPSVKPFYTNLCIPTSTEAWPNPPTGQPKRASVNSFGFGGTNAHAIVEQYQPAIHDAVAHTFSPRVALSRSLATTGTADGPAPSLPILLSANSQKTLATVVETYLDYISTNDIQPEQLGWHTYSRRTALPYRVSVSATTRLELTDGLEKITGSSSPVGTRSRPTNGLPKILGIFTGQGAQWATMSKGLLLTSNIYRDSIRSLDNVLRLCSEPPSWTLEQEILAQGALSRVGKAAISQPLCTAIQIALVDLLKSLGVSFHTVVGHSSGEIAAAYAAGQLSARDAMLISYFRGLYAHLACGATGSKGGILAVGLSKQDAAELCTRKEYMGGICVAASNAPSSVTLSGDLDVVKRVRDDLMEQKKFARLLEVDTAYHSPHMQVPAVRYLEALASCHISPTAVGNGTVWVSSVYDTGEPTPGELEGAYWRDNMVHPVLFYEAVRTALQEQGPFDCVVEVGAHPALKGPVTQTVKIVQDSVINYTGLLDRKKDDRLAFSEFMGLMWTWFGPKAIQLHNFVENSSRPSLMHHRLEGPPTYPWDHSQIHYRESRVSRQYHFRTHGPHELLGVRTRDDDEYELRWRNILKLDKIPWIEHHKFQGQALLPASAYCVMAVDAARVVLAGRDASLIELENLQFQSGIHLEPDSQGVEVLFSLRILPASKETGLHSTIEATFTITSAPADGLSPLNKNFFGNLRIVLAKPSPYALPPRAKDLAEASTVDTNGFYEMMAETGLDYSGPFKAMVELQRRFNFSSAKVKKRHGQDTTKLTISPATLDSCLQSAFASYSSPGDKALWTPFLPETIERVRFNLAICDMDMNDESVLAVDTFLTNVQPITKDSSASFTGDICIYNQNGEMEVQVQGLTVASFAPTRPENDYELYLTTVMELDPEDEIVSTPVCDRDEPCPVLVESCERVASFYLHEARLGLPRSTLSQTTSHAPLETVASNTHNGWPGDTLDAIEDFIRKSPYLVSLDFIRTLGANLPDVLPGMLPVVIEEAHQLVNFQDHLGRVVRQIAHRYPRMDVLGLTDSEFGLNEPILAGLKSSFLTYTIGNGEDLLLDRFAQSQYRKKVTVKRIDLEQGFGDEEEGLEYDLVVVSTSLIKTQSTTMALKTLRQKMKPGAFLILVHVSRSPLKARMKKVAGFLSDSEDMFTPPDYPDVLDQCGFRETMRNSHQYFPPGFSIIVRQVESELKWSVLRPLAQMAHVLTEHLLIVGGNTDRTSRIFKDVCEQLQPCSTTLTAVASLDIDMDPSVWSSFTAAIFLQDLDEPILSTMTESRLEVLKSLLKPAMVILWVTCKARSGNPDHAASFGFGRTMLAEIPSLTMRVLDIDSLETSSHLIAPEFARLTMAGVARAAKHGDLVWSHEPEVHIDSAGRRLVPRVLPWSAANDRVNAPRRLVTTPTNTLEHKVEIVPSQSPDGSACYETKVCSLVPQTPVPEQTTIKVDYSSVDVLKLDWTYSSHVCVGRSMPDGGIVAALSKLNASFVTVPQTSVTPLGQAPINTPVFISLLIRYLTSLSIADNVHDRSVLLIEPDELLLDCIQEVFLGRGIGLRVCTADVEKSRKTPGIQLLHAHSTIREIKSVFPPDGAYVFDFLPESNLLSEVIVDSLPENCEYHSRYSLLASDHLNTHEDAASVQAIWEQGVKLALARSATLDGTDTPSVTSVPDLLNASEQPGAFQILDWKKERTVAHAIKPLVEKQLLRPYKTYVLVGLTRDLGQSLCRLFIEHGARNIVLASRNPNQSPKWRDELIAAGAKIQIEVLDVTSLEDVLRFKQKLSQTMPPVAGIVNGAMVLDDRVFSQMTLETLNRVMLPKTVGSKNLDVAFDSPEMDFFIMTSSFAAIGGHAGQSNYAAANMYMNGLAASRRSRGLPGTAINIGVIYGLGFLHRELDHLYAGLEREGYPPISERDLHHMFLEAIVAGRPGSQITDITTGLRRFRVDDSNPLHWHLDPRFSHFTVAGPSHAVDGYDDAAGMKQSLAELMEQADTVAAAAEILLPPFQRHLESLLRLPKESVGGDSSLGELGVDSLVAVDIRSWIWKTVGQDVAVMKVLGATSIAKRNSIPPPQPPYSP